MKIRIGKGVGGTRMGETIFVVFDLFSIHAKLTS